jgi:anti-sigma factor RsiW
MANSHDHITCQEVVELVTDYLDEAMSVDEASLFEQHLNFCDGCVWYVDQLRTTISAAARIREEDLEPDARDRLMAAFRDWRRS